MPRIPMGNFGNAMHQVERIRLPESQTGQMLAGALQNISQTTGQHAEKIDKQQQEAEVSAKRLELYNNDLAEKEAKVKLDDVLTTEMSEQVTLLKNDVSNGLKTADVANKTFKTWSDTRFKELESELPGHAQPNLKNYWSDNINRQTADFLPLQLRADMQKGIVLADRMGEIATRYDRTKGREYLESNLSTLNLSEADKQSRLYTYESVRDQLDIDDRITVALEGKDIQSLKTLQTDLNSSKFGYLDGKQIQHNKDRVSSRIDALNTQLKAEENKRVAEAGKFLNEYKSNVLTGRAQDKDYEANVAQLVAGTEHESEFKFLQSQSLNFQKFANKSTSEQLSLINAQKAKMKNSASANASEEEKILSTYEGMYKDKLQVVKDNPNQAVREVGLKVNVLSGMLLKTDTGSWIDGAIDNGTSQLALKDPNIKLKPISAEDLPEAKKAFDGMSIDQKLSFIGGMINKTKGIKNGASIWGATLGQLGAGDQSYIMAGVARMNGFKSTQGEDVATAIISGNQAIKNKHLIMPKDDLLNQKFNEYVGNSASGDTANMTFAGFKSIYAHIAERDNYQHKDKDDISDSIAKTALGLVTGGVYDQMQYGEARSGKSKWKVSKPYGMSDERFEAIIDSRYSTISQKYKISESELKGLRLRREKAIGPKGQIRYALINEHNTPLFYMDMPDGVTK
jgi:hypothetical protein